jgi:hypothetical protein
MLENRGILVHTAAFQSTEDGATQEGDLKRQLKLFNHPLMFRTRDTDGSKVNQERS